MRSHGRVGWLAVLALVCLPAAAGAQIPQGSSYPESAAAIPPLDLQTVPAQYDLAGPRLGGTFGPRGEARSQFGWHFEHQIASAARGPWLVVETVLLVGGVEQHEFIPSGTLVFGARTPEGFEVGVGPSLTLSALGFRSGLVAAVGRTFRIAGIQIPLNLAYAFDRDGGRISVVTGWAVRRTPNPA